MTFAVTWADAIPLPNSITAPVAAAMPATTPARLNPLVDMRVCS
jgi:hypothetical protein